MKLVDILARELKEWPEGVHGCDSITQDDDGLLNSTGTGCVPNRVGGAWRSGASSYIENGQGGELSAELACDWDKAIVTRAQWQAAVDALKAGEQAWDGEGLPPVGTVCEAHKLGGVLSEKYKWFKVQILAHWLNDDRLSPVAIYMPLPGSDPSVGQGVENCFRPARTAEQIAAEEREAGIRQIQIDHEVRARDGGRVIAEKLWDMGYRKQVQP